MSIFKVTNDMLIDGKFNPSVIPDGTTKIDFIDCRDSLRSVEGATFNGYAYFRDCTGLTSVEGAVFNGYIDFTGCTGLTSAAGATFNDHTDFTGCTGLTSVAGATFSRVANFEGCTGLTSVEGATFSSGANFEGCTGLTSVEGAVFYGYTDFTGCTGLTSIEGATFNGYAYFIDCTGLTSVEGAVFDGYTDFTGCTGLTSVAGATFSSGANFKGCTGLTSAAGATFNGYAYFRDCTGLTSLEGAVFNVYTDFTGCTGLTSIEGATFNRGAHFNGCTGLTSAAGATFNGNVNLIGCSSLVPTPELISNLEALEASGKVVIWPEHFSRGNIVDDAKKRLTTIIDRYKITNPSGAAATSTLFNRFLSEGLWQRDGRASVVKSIAPFLDFIEREPQHLKWVEEIASGALDGCVNQPVAAYMEIAALVKVAQAPDMTSKIEAARQLRALEALKEFVAKHDPKPGVGVEVEAGNAIAREVNSKLQLSWAGVPGSISYEGTVKSWLKDKKVDDAAQRVLESNAEDIYDVVGYLCGRHLYAFAAIAFPHELARIEDKYNTEKNLLQELTADTSIPLPEEYQRKLTNGESLTEEIRSELLHAAYNSLDINKNVELTARITGLTVEMLVAEKDRMGAEVHGAATGSSAGACTRTAAGISTAEFNRQQEIVAASASTTLAPPVVEEIRVSNPVPAEVAVEIGETAVVPFVTRIQAKQRQSKCCSIM